MSTLRRDFADQTDLTLHRDFMQLLSEEFCRRHQVVLLGGRPASKETPATLGMLDVSDAGLIKEVEELTGLTIRHTQLNAYEIDRALDFAFKGSAQGSATLNPNPVRDRIVLGFDQQMSFQRDRKPAEIASDILAIAVQRRASDIHIEVYSNDVSLRYRIDGVLQKLVSPLSPENIMAVVQHLKVIADLNIADRRLPQDGHIVARYTAPDQTTRRIDFRVSTLPGLYGEDCVLRVLDETCLTIKLESLGMSNEKFSLFHAMLHEPGGLILVSGPTSSGKTTTLYAVIEHIKDDSKKILTVEDPIEYEIARVNQKQITPAISFADYTRAFMRQNPDIVMIGEVRDEETASMAVRASQMGHLVLTTLHSRDSASAVARMLSLGVERNVLAAGLIGVLAQRLVRRVCIGCIDSYQPAPETLELLPGLPKGIPFRHGKGCELCGGSGYRGLSGVFELLRIDAKLRQVITRGETGSAALLPLPAGFRCLYDYAIEKVAQGVTTVEEIVRTIPVPARFDNLPGEH